MKNKNTPDPSITHKTLKCLLQCDIGAIVILLILSIVVMYSCDVEKYFVGLTNAGNKLELLKFIGWIISGLIAILGVIGLFQRATALDKQNEINQNAHDQQTEALEKQRETNEKNHKQQAAVLKEQRETNEKSHVQERFKAATEHLGNERASVRIAAFYEFYRLIKIESEPDLREHVFDILCAHLRQTTKHKDYTPEEKVLKDGAKKIKPTEEVQSLLNILFKPRNNDKFIFDGLVANLEETNLQGANLRNAELQKANLRQANLRNADITYANLQKAEMWKVDLRNAFLRSANLQEAEIVVADLRGAILRLKSPNRKLSQEESKNANLKDAFLWGSKINQDTIMPNDWKNVVKKDTNGEPGVVYVED